MRCLLLLALVAGTDGVHDEIGGGSAGVVDDVIEGLDDGPLKNKIKGIVRQAKDVFGALRASDADTLTDANLQEGNDREFYPKFFRFVASRLNGRVSIKAIDSNCDEAIDVDEFAAFFVRAMFANRKDSESDWGALPDAWPKEPTCQMDEEVVDEEGPDKGVDEEGWFRNEKKVVDEDVDEEVVEGCEEATEQEECEGPDVNTASKGALGRVYGVGRVTVKAIVEGRPYDSVRNFCAKFSKLTVGKKGTSGADVWKKNLKKLFDAKKLCVV